MLAADHASSKIVTDRTEATFYPILFNHFFPQYQIRY